MNEILIANTGNKDDQNQASILPSITLDLRLYLVLDLPGYLSFDLQWNHSIRTFLFLTLIELECILHCSV